MEVVAGVAGLAPGQGRRGCASVASLRWVTGRTWGTAYPAGVHNVLLHGQGCCGRSPPAPQLHSVPQYWEGSKLPDAPACHSSQETCAR